MENESKESIKIKYRPQKFSEMFGAETNKRSFISEIRNIDSNSYLLIGNRGCGKTTFSRLMANHIVKKYNATKRDIIEINVSNNNGVDSARSIEEECKMPHFGNCKVYILNEVHRATSAWQDVMLEILEHPPKYTFFILCTTEPEKLDSAITSRLTKYKFNELNKEDFDIFFKSILEKEEIEFDDEIKDKIFISSCGIPRECLSIIGAIKNLKKDAAIKYIDSYKIDTEKDENIKELNKELFSYKSIDDALKILDSISENPETIRYAIINYFYRIVVKPFGKTKEDRKEARNKAVIIIECFKDSVYNTGKAGLALAICNYYSE